MVVVYLWLCRLFKSDNKDLNPKKIYKIQSTNTVSSIKIKKNYKTPNRSIFLAVHKNWLGKI